MTPPIVAIGSLHISVPPTLARSSREIQPQLPRALKELHREREDALVLATADGFEQGRTTAIFRIAALSGEFYGAVAEWRYACRVSFPAFPTRQVAGSNPARSARSG